MIRMILIALGLHELFNEKNQDSAHATTKAQTIFSVNGLLITQNFLHNRDTFSGGTLL